MTFADPIGDMITRIRNAQMRLLTNVKIPGSKYREKILEVLKKEGFISNYKVLFWMVINLFIPLDKGTRCKNDHLFGFFVLRAVVNI